MFTTKIYINTLKNHALMLRIINNRKKAELSLGFRMEEATLADAMSPNPRPENLSYRLLLNQWQMEIENVKLELAKQSRGDEDPRTIKSLISESLFGKTEATEDCATGNFLPFFKARTDAYLKRSTRESNEYTLSCMRKFAPDSLDAMNFEDVTYAWLSDFENYMKKSGLSQNTRKIHFGNIRAAMREAYKRELTNSDPFRRFTFRPAKTRKRSLTVDELRSLFNYPVIPQTAFYRDMMMLSFMLLGINTVDLYNLAELRNGRAEYARSKTGGIFSVKVEPEAMAIIDRYRGKKNLLCIADRWNDHRNFRHQMNAAIKRIGKAQGKGRKDSGTVGPFAEVTSYWMRHTWATLAYELGVGDDTISQALGHQGSGARVTEVYIRRNMDKVDEANRRVLDWVLYGKR